MTQSGNNRPISWRKNLFFTWLSQLLSLAGFAVVMPFIPVYMRDVLGISDPRLRGWYVSLFYFFGMLSFAVFTPVWGVLADRYGRKMMLLRANFASALIMPFLAFAPNVGLLIAVRFVVSIFSGTVNAAQTLIVATTPEEHHGFALGTLSSALWSGNMLGYLAGGLLVHYFGYVTTFVLCGGLFLIGGLLILFFVREDFVPPVHVPAPEAEKRKIHLPAFGKTLWTILFLFLAMAFARRFDEPYLALQVEAVNGLADTAYFTGLISAAAACGGVLAGVSIGWLCDRFSPEKIAVPAVLISACAMIGQGWAPNLLCLGAGRFLAFFTAGGLEPVFQTMLSKASPPEKRGQVFGWSATFRTAGLLVASLFGGGIIYRWGIRSVYATGCAGFLLLIPLLLYAFRLIRKKS